MDSVSSGHSPCPTTEHVKIVFQKWDLPGRKCIGHQDIQGVAVKPEGKIPEQLHDDLTSGAFLAFNNAGVVSLWAATQAIGNASRYDLQIIVGIDGDPSRS